MKLHLEACILEKGLVWEGMSIEKKKMIRKSSSQAIRLWSGEVLWHKPILDFSLLTSPGLNLSNTLCSLPSDFFLRWCVTYATQETRKGGIIKDKEAWATYYKKPEAIYSDIPPYYLVVPISTAPVFSTHSTGKRKGLPINQPSKARTIVVCRKGKMISLFTPSTFIPCTRAIKETALPKYSTSPDPRFCLDASAFPPGTPDYVITKAVGAFAASVAQSTQKTYATAFTHLKEAEKMLGRSFSSPPTEKEMLLFTSLLASKGLKRTTITSYLSGLRFISFSRGATNPTKLPQLGLQLLAGISNSDRNAKVEAEKVARRPITLNMVVLLGHAIATKPNWSDFERSLRWTVILLGFWGSFRMGELIGQEKFKFNSDTSLMPGDIKFLDNSVSLWLRNPKVVSAGGDVVEVWAVQERPDLDPVLALQKYMSLRNERFGLADTWPVFLHDTGAIFSKAQLNLDLKKMLDLFPPLATSTRDKWSGHSFRAGLTSLLQSLGFTEKQIKSWGRWKSAAYLLYTQDMAARRETRSRLTATYSKVLATL